MRPAKSTEHNRIPLLSPLSLHQTDRPVVELFGVWQQKWQHFMNPLHTTHAHVVVCVCMVLAALALDVDDDDGRVTGEIRVWRPAVACMLLAAATRVLVCLLGKTLCPGAQARTLRVHVLTLRGLCRWAVYIATGGNGFFRPPKSPRLAVICLTLKV